MSNKRRAALSLLDSHIFNLIRGGKYKEGVVQVERMIELLKQEQLDSPAQL